MKRVWWAFALVVLAALGGVAYQTWLGPARSQTPAPSGRPAARIPVVVAEAKVMATPVRIDTIGSVMPVANVTIKSRIDGYIDTVLIHDGQFVKTGDVMFRLDSRAAQAQVQQMQAQLARDQAQLVNAKRDVGRYEPLVKKDFVSRQQYDTATTTAQALDGAVAGDQAMLDNMKVQLSYLTIVAPIDGRVGMVSIKSGNSIKSNDLPLATINQIKPIYVGFNLPQSEFPALRQAMAKGPVTVSVLPQGDSGAPVAGTVAFFDNAVDTTSGTIAVRASFANDDQRLWPGQFVKVSITTRTDPSSIVVTPAAVQVGQEGDFVYVIKQDNTAELRPISVSRTVDGNAVIAKGLAAGERVVIDGQMRLTNGARVEIRQPAQQQTKPAEAS
jgi:multidrug efflux system membrane fusion protein